MLVTINKKIDNCIECPYHSILSDPDPYDSFCKDDCAVRCMIAKGEPKTGEYKQYYGGMPMITVACRPYNIEKECIVPDWCPFSHPENRLSNTN